MKGFGKGSHTIRELVVHPVWGGEPRGCLIDGKLSCGHATMFTNQKQVCYECERIKRRENTAARR